MIPCPPTGHRLQSGLPVTVYTRNAYASPSHVLCSFGRSCLADGPSCRVLTTQNINETEYLYWAEVSLTTSSVDCDVAYSLHFHRAINHQPRRDEPSGHRKLITPYVCPLSCSASILSRRPRSGPILRSCYPLSSLPLTSQWRFSCLGSRQKWERRPMHNSCAGGPEGV